MHLCECMYSNVNTHSRMAYSYLAGCPGHLITASEHHNNAQKSYLIYTTLCCDLKRLKFWIQSSFFESKIHTKNGLFIFWERFLVWNIYGIWTVKHFFLIITYWHSLRDAITLKFLEWLIFSRLYTVMYICL